MEVMTEHSFMASWNYVQYREARKNISLRQVIFVHDFAQNYLCEQQNEAQGLHWSHKQVTLMPTVAHYRCPKSEQLVTHEIVHISGDLKHDAHLVKLFTSKSIEVLKSNNVDICKIIEFMDQNKTAFNYLANSKLPTQRNYFGTRHGKSSCDACTGRVKQGVSRLVKSEQAVVDDAQSFYDTCIQHLEKPLVQSDKCQHHILTFELHKKIVKRPSTLQLVGTPDTRKLHQIGNTGGKVLNFRKFSCCCYGCLHGTESCQNAICPSEWSGFHLAKKKVTEANLDFWLGERTQNICTICHVLQRWPPFPVSLCDWLPSDSRDCRCDARAGVLWLSIHCPIGTDPLVVCCPLVDKEQASANQRPFCHSVQNDRGHAWEGLSQSEASPPLGMENAVICYWRPI